LVFVRTEGAGGLYETFRLCAMLSRLGWLFSGHSMPPLGYIAYIDESGDDGIRRVRPIDPGGASEWFVLAALVIEARHESRIPQWHADILSKSTQRRDIHFNKMGEAHRLAACEYLAGTTARIFVAVSWKPTMRGYRNPRAEKVGGKNIFYNFMTRILLEKVTNYCYRHSMARYKKPTTVRMEFSRRGGMFYQHTLDYLTKLYFQSKNKTLVLSQYDLAWDVVDLKEIYHFDHQNRMGVQIADIPAASFFQALGETNGAAPDLRYAELLRPRIAKGPDGIVFGTGLKLMYDIKSYHYNTLPLSDGQRAIFETFGAPR
jgi:hypothetical protein